MGAETDSVEIAELEGETLPCLAIGGAAAFNKNADLILDYGLWGVCSVLSGDKL